MRTDDTFPSVCIVFLTALTVIGTYHFDYLWFYREEEETAPRVDGQRKSGDLSVLYPARAHRKFFPCSKKVGEKKTLSDIGFKVTLVQSRAGEKKKIVEGNFPA